MDSNELEDNNLDSASEDDEDFKLCDADYCEKSQKMHWFLHFRK